MSEAHVIKVVPLIRKPHTNSDNLEIVSIDDSYQVVINKEQWAGIEKAAWIRPDNIVDLTRPEFAWLKTGDELIAKVKPMKIRNELSYGFLARVPDTFNIGDDVTEYLGVKPYEPETSLLGEAGACPPGFSNLSKYDIENVKGKVRAFEIFEKVILQEKINGENCRVVWTDDRLFVGSRNMWKSESNENSQFWNAVKACPGLIEFCKAHPRVVVYGEVYGRMKNFRYDSDGEPKFACFDIMKEGGAFVDAELLEPGCKKWGIPTVPILGQTNFYLPEIEHLAEQQSSLCVSQMREGIVIVPLKERIHPKYGRVKHKCISLRYLQS